MQDNGRQDDDEGTDDFAQMDDAALIAMRGRMREELQRLPPHSLGHVKLSARYDRSTQEIDDRARRAWAKAKQGATS